MDDRKKVDVDIFSKENELDNLELWTPICLIEYKNLRNNKSKWFTVFLLLKFQNKWIYKYKKLFLKNSL